LPRLEVFTLERVALRVEVATARFRPGADLDGRGVERQDSPLSRRDVRLRPQTQAKINGQLPG